MTIDQLRRELREAERRRNELLTELENLRSREAAGGDDADLDGLRERMANVNRGVARADEQIREHERQIGLLTLAERADRRDRDRYVDGGEADRERERERRDGDRTPGGEHRERALRAIERLGLDAGPGDRLVELVERDRSGIDARYVEATADAAYERAFTLLLAHPQDAHLRMTPVEAEAARRVATVSAERALAIGDGASGGWAVPILIDPTVIPTSPGQINPLRDLATVRQITSSELRLVTSAGVVASYDAEATEVSDDSPSLEQPVANVEKAQCWIAFSIEAGGDWPGLRDELGHLLLDAKDALEAQIVHRRARARVARAGGDLDRRDFDGRDRRDRDARPRRRLRHPGVAPAALAAGRDLAVDADGRERDPPHVRAQQRRAAALLARPRPTARQGLAGEQLPRRDDRGGLLGGALR